MTSMKIRVSFELLHGGSEQEAALVVVRRDAVKCGTRCAAAHLVFCGPSANVRADGISDQRRH